MWQPLTDHWESYKSKLEEAEAEGLLDDPTEAQSIIYPDELFLGEGEKDDVRDFITERLNELFQHYQHTEGKFDPNVVGTYIFRSIILGMMWERERIGL